MGQLRVLMQVLIELFLGIPQARVAGQDLIDTAHDHPPPRGAHALGLIIARSIQVGCLSPAGAVLSQAPGHVAAERLVVKRAAVPTMANPPGTRTWP